MHGEHSLLLFVGVGLGGGVGGDVGGGVGGGTGGGTKQSDGIGIGRGSLQKIVSCLTDFAFSSTSTDAGTFSTIVACAIIEVRAK